MSKRNGIKTEKMINFLPKLRPHTEIISVWFLCFNNLLETFLKDKFKNDLNFLRKNDDIYSLKSNAIFNNNMWCRNNFF